MVPTVVECIARPGHRLWLKFADGASGEVDLSHLVGQGVFLVWNDPREFAKAAVDAESGTVCWPGGIDLDPYVLYSRITGAALPGQGSQARGVS